MRLAVALIVLAMLACALIASHSNRPLLIPAAEATMIVCNPQPTPELIRWNRSKVVRT